MNGVFVFIFRLGNLFIRVGIVCVIGYLFNSMVGMGMIFLFYIYNSIFVIILNMNSDFMVYDLGDIVNVSIISYNLLVSFM